MSPGDQSKVNEEALVGGMCMVCDLPAVDGECGCNGAPMTDLDLEELRRRLPGDQLARVVRRVLDVPDVCSDGHIGPWTVVSRHGSVSPHVQCSGCGFIDRATGMDRIVTEGVLDESS